MNVVVLGFDGMEPSLFERLADEGDIPGFRRLREEGCYSRLDSTAIPISAMAWSSFATGVNPGKHGIYDFVTRSGPDSTAFELTTAAHRQAPAMWEYLHARDRRVGVVGMPMTYPIDGMDDGFMVTGYPTPSPEASYWPPDLDETAPVDPAALHPKLDIDGATEDRVVEDQFRQFEAVERFHRHALEEREWDVLVSVFMQTDDISHVAWDSPALHDIYRRCDEVVRDTRERLAAMDEDYLLITLSDHGFGPIDRRLFLNNALRDLGYLRLRDRPGTRARDLLCSAGVNVRNTYHLADALGVGEAFKSAGLAADSLTTRLLHRIRTSLLLGPDDVDVDGSACFSRGNYGQVFVEDEAVTDDLVEELSAYTVDGERIVADVHRASELFHGDAVDIAPDLMIESPGYRYLSAKNFALATDRVLSDTLFGRDAEHKKKGVFFATGSDVCGDADLTEPSLEDVLPTIMVALGEPVPSYLDGDVIDLFAGETDPTYEEYAVEAGATGTEMTPAERAAVRSQLESLGYATDS